MSPISYILYSVKGYINLYINFFRLLPERQLLLGPDLAAAHFLVNRGASIKFLGDEEWHQMNKKKEYVLPARRIDGNIFILIHFFPK